jgi:hypothetical protein
MRPGPCLGALLCLGSACLIDFREGLPCTDDAECDGYLCRSATCTSPSVANATLTLCRVPPGSSTGTGFCTRPCTRTGEACPSKVSGHPMWCDGDPAVGSPGLTFCQPTEGYAAWSQLQPSCSSEADCQGVNWP